MSSSTASVPGVDPEPPATSRRSEAPGVDDTSSTPGAFVLKLLLLALVNGLGVYLVLAFVGIDKPAVAVAVGAALGVVNVVYLRRRHEPAKYILPGLIFLIVFQFFVLGYTVSISLTNSGDGHNIDKTAAIDAIQRNSIRQVPDSPAYAVQVVERDGVLHLLATSPSGEALIGSNDAPLASAPGAVMENGRAVSLDGFETLTLQQLLARQDEVTSLQVPLSEDPANGTLRTADTRTGYVYATSLEYDPATDTLTDVGTDATFVDNGTGNFESSDGEILQPGWQATVGFANYDEALRTATTGSGGLVDVALWTLGFAVASTVLTFSVGIGMALLFDHPGMRGRRIYRAIMILPYAFPFFLSGLVWSGLLNSSFGYINQVLLGGAEIPWLLDPVLAKITVILVSVWFGMPYWFLVGTGALQAIPSELIEAAKADGAGAWTTFYRIQLPLLLSTTSPLIVAGFAFSLNDFTTIFMLSNGGPTNPASPIGAGHTDILITVVYKLAFVGGSADYGLASALSVLIFLITAMLSIGLFFRTKRLEVSM